MSQFADLLAEFPDVHEAAIKAETAARPDPRTACFYARRALEQLVHWVYKHDPALRLPYQDNLSALIHEPTFKAAAGEAVFTTARVITRLGNEAVHSRRCVNCSTSATGSPEACSSTSSTMRAAPASLRSRRVGRRRSPPDALKIAELAALRRRPEGVTAGVAPAHFRHRQRHRVAGPRLGGRASPRARRTTTGR